MPVDIDFDYLRSLLSRKKDRAAIDRIEEDRRRILEGGAPPQDRRYFHLELEGIVVCVRRDLATASVDTLLEIFRDRAHMKLPPFRPENNSTVLDIGANEGFYSLYMKRHNPGLRLVCVEPVPATCRILKRNITANGFHNVHVVQSAVIGGNAYNSLHAQVEMDVYPHVSSISSLDIGILDRPWINPSKIQKIRVPAVTLAGLLQRFELDTVDLLKLDVEGSEGEILEQSGDVLTRFRKIAVEWHSPSLRERCRILLEGLGEFHAIIGLEVQNIDVQNLAPLVQSLHLQLCHGPPLPPRWLRILFKDVRGWIKKKF